MPNYRKSFNFRNGVQVDEDNFIVNPLGLVGIGTTVPSELLDVLGNAKISGILSVNQLYVNNITNNVGGTGGDFTQINVGVTSISSGIITATSQSELVTYYGDGGKLLNLPTSQWVDVNVGLGFTSIYAQGFVGVGTIDPRFLFQVGGNNSVFSFINGVGIDNNGNILATGIVTARSFVGFGSEITLLNANNLTLGNLTNSIFPSNINLSGIITAGNYFNGRLVGVANTADSITNTSNIRVNSINSGFSTSGISTVTDKLHIEGSVGVGTLNPNSDIHLRRTSSNAQLQITSDSNIARLILGRSTGTLNGVVIQTGDSSGSNSEVTINSLDIRNYAPGNLNNFIRPSSTPNIKFNWINDFTNSILMSLTDNGRLGLGITNPNTTLSVVGTSTVTENSFVGGNLYISDQVFANNNLNVSNNVILSGNLGIKTTSPVNDLQIGANPLFGNGISINSNGNVKSTGIVTAVSFSGDGSQLTSLNPGNIGNGSLNGSLNINTSGIVTASSFVGNGFNLTSIRPENIQSGSLSGNYNIGISGGINLSGVITATSFTGDGSNLSNLTPENIGNGTIDGNINVFTTGIVTAASVSATSFIGSGSNLTNLTPENIGDGTISGTKNIDINGSININSAGIITSPGGFTSGEGLPVEITTSENNNSIILTVSGIGSVTLPLVPFV